MKQNYFNEEVDFNEELEEIEETPEAAAEEAEKMDIKSIKLDSTDPLKMLLRDVGGYPILSKEEEAELAKKKDEGSAVAREKLINCNLRLVVYLAKKKYDRVREAGSANATLEDLIQAGSLGLVTAVDRFDWTMGRKLSTSAYYWINNEINAWLSNNSRLIRIPEHKVDEMLVVKRSSNELNTVLGREPDAEEISAYLNYRFTVKEVTNLQQLIFSSIPISFDSPIGEDEDDGTVGDIVADQSETPEEAHEKETTSTAVVREVSNLPEKERIVITMSFGVCNEKKSTLEEIADRLYQTGYTNRNGGCITKEGVRQIKERALEILRKRLTGVIGG